MDTVELKTGIIHGRDFNVFFQVPATDQSLSAALFLFVRCNIIDVCKRGPHIKLSNTSNSLIEEITALILM